MKAFTSHGLSRLAQWGLKALAVGIFPAGALGLLMGGGHWRFAGSSALVGVIFALVMWPGFEFTSGWVHQRNPHRSAGREALLSQLRWVVVYACLLGVATALVRLVVGFALWRNAGSFLLASLLGLLISSVITGYHTTRNLVSTVRDLERAKAQAGFLALEAQLSPHTLFNALNTIAALIPEAPLKAEAATEHLARLLRQVMAALEQDAWSLSKEFDLLQELLALEQLRFGERLHYELFLDPAEASLLVPPLLLLPLVENALKHGFRPKPGPCTLKVEAIPGRIRIEDDGVGFGPLGTPDAPSGRKGNIGTDREGLGLRTVRQRLEPLEAELRWLDAAQGCALEIRWRVP